VKEARNQSQILNRKSISRNTTHRQSYHLIQILASPSHLVSFIFIRHNRLLEAAASLRHIETFQTIEDIWLLLALGVAQSVT